MIKLFKQTKKRFSVALCVSPQAISVLLVDHETSNSLPIIVDSLRFEINENQSVESGIETLKTFINTKKLNETDCYCVLSETDYQLLLIDPPEVPENELLDAMRWRVKDLIESNIDDVVIDTFQQPDKKMMYTVVADKKKILDIVNMVKALDLSLIAIDIEELAYRNFFEQRFWINSNSKELDESDLNKTNVSQQRALAVVNIDKSEGRVLIFKQGQLYLSRRFSLNYGDALIDSLPEEEIILELQRSLDYFERQMNQPPPAEILFLCPSLINTIPAAIKQSFQQTIACFSADTIFPDRDIDLTLNDVVKLYGCSMWKESA